MCTVVTNFSDLKSSGCFTRYPAEHQLSFVRESAQLP